MPTTSHSTMSGLIYAAKHASFVMGVIAFWLFAQTTLNVEPDMQKYLGLDASMRRCCITL